MKTLNGTEITYDHVFNLLEAMKDSFHAGDEIISLLDYCKDLLSDSRLNIYPDIELHNCNKITFNYENYNDILGLYNHLVITINTYGINYNDKILSYYYIKGNNTNSDNNISWNDVLKIIKDWYKE